MTEKPFRQTGSLIGVRIGEAEESLSLLTREEYNDRALQLLRQFHPTAISARHVITWRDANGSFHKDSMTITIALPIDPDKRGVIIALGGFKPGEIVPLKILGRRCGKPNAVSNSTFQKKLRELADDGYITIHRGQGYELTVG